MDAPSYDLRLQAPFTMQVTGGTSSGKSFWTRRLLENAHVMMHPPPDRIIYAYGEWQDMFTEMKDVEFVRGVTESLVSRENLNGPILPRTEDHARCEFEYSSFGDFSLSMRSREHCNHLQTNVWHRL